jgi:hypothetical protein
VLFSGFDSPELFHTLAHANLLLEDSYGFDLGFDPVFGGSLRWMSLVILRYALPQQPPPSGSPIVMRTLESRITAGNLPG